MANSTIKITQLPPIGNNLTASTILPVVSLTGTATTDKVAVSNIANFTLLNAGNTLPPAYLSNLTYSVVNAAQPNITSLGNLSGLRITNLSNFYLPGGTNGQLLSTNGSGNLTWVTGNVSGGTPGGSNSQVQFNNNGNFAGNSAFTFDSTNSILTTTNFVSVNANITGALTTPSLAVTGTSNTRNIIANGNITANFFIGSGSQLSNISGANVSGNVPNATFATTSANANFATTANYSAFAGNVTINAQANITSLGNLTGLQSNGAVFINNNTNSTSNATGALRVLGGIGATGNIHSGNEIHSRGNVIVGGNTLFVGPTAEATGLTNPAVVIFHAGDQYIQAALKNSLSNGSADWVAYGDNGTDSQGWSDMGFTSSTFNDANYTITGSGDGYLFVETFAGSYGGNLVIATGNLGTVKDIIFATDGFLTENEFGRISDSNNSFELTRTGATITFPDGSIQNTAYTGGGDTGNVTFNNVNIIGDGNLYLQPDPANAGAYLDIFLTSGPDIHIAGNGETVILGTDDFANVAVNVDGNVSIQAGDANGTHTWNFGTDGNLTLPDTTSVIANVSITLEANDTGNITGLNLIGDYHANLYAHGNVMIVADSSNTNQTWTFDNSGNLTVPGSLINDTAIVLSAPAVFNVCTISTGGSGYNTGSSLKATTGGSGTGMTVGIGYGLAGQLVSVTVVNSGTGYVNGDVITVSDGTGGTFVITKYNQLANQTNNNTVQTNLTFGNNRLTLPTYGEILSNANIVLTTNNANAGNTHSWIFAANGSVTLPGDLIGNGASPAPSISGFDSANFVGNVTADYFLGNGSQLTNLPAPAVAQDITSNGAMSIMTYDGNLKYVNYATVEPSSGNIAGGNISATGNVTANNYIGNGNTLSNVAIQTTGNWTLTPGVNTVSITVPINGTYSIWVRGNIPNGIVTYTATVVVTNTNVPVVGSSYGWYYAAGNALVLTAIPTQIVGTVNNISNAVVSTTTANVFTFDITNNSGSSQVVNWGYTKL